MVPVCVILSLGVWNSIIALGLGVPSERALGLLVLDFLPNRIKNCSVIVEDPWWFLGEFWWVLISFPLFSMNLKDFVGVLGAAGAPVTVVSLPPPHQPLYQALG